MAGGRFRERTARMDAVLVDRLGDGGFREDGSLVLGFFVSPFFGGDVVGGKHTIGAVSNADEVAQPTFTVRAVDAVNLPKGATVTMDLPVSDGGGEYVVVRQKPADSGFVDLEMRLKNGRANGPA